MRVPGTVVALPESQARPATKGTWTAISRLPRLVASLPHGFPGAVSVRQSFSTISTGTPSFPLKNFEKNNSI